ncbi:biotin--[acetyl-CoA-carboxylase] ligase [Nocardioides aurantiacus]|uniref:biotin--[acetyl-CoA-carboxylase] ligase n=1 Tax=Nocardioides aurantiacus TaxID=86796 RepID=UPI00403FBEC6
MNAEQPRRPPLDATRVGSTGRWRVEVVESSGSTNADVASRYAAGEDDGLVLVAEHQSAGRGRLGREWVSPARSSLTVSFLLVPPAGVRPERWGWLPLATGLAAAAAVRRSAGVEVALKWPNDVLAEDGRKLGGILLERVERDGAPAAVIGIGLNCTQAQDELPVPEATSLALAGAAGAAGAVGEVDRAALLGALVEELDGRLARWVEGEDLRPAYVARCTTLGRQVRVTVPGGEVLGEAVDVDADGQLVVRTDAGEQHLGAGDVVHVRPAGAS